MSASIDGVQLGPDSGASWTFTSGTAPHQVNIRMDKAAAAAVFNAHVEGSEFATLTIGDLSVYVLILGESPTDTPHQDTLTLSDRRWYWPRRWIKRSYNVRRRTGSTKDVGGGANLANLQQDVDFQPWSLKGGNPWTAKEVLEDVLGQIHWGAVVFDSGTAGLPIIEDLEIDSPGDVAVGRVLAALGGNLSIYLDRVGKAHVYDLQDGSESTLLGAIAPGKTTTKGAASTLPMVVGFPVFDFSDRRAERPATVEVLFSAIVELRFDADETGTTTAEEAGGTQTAAEVSDLKCMNVVAIPEAATINGADLAVGSWVPLPDYLDYLSGQAQPKGLPTLTYAIINKAWLHSALEVYGTLDPSGLWARRIAAVRSAYRRTYRIERPYSESARQFTARRVQLQDVESDGYLAAPAYFDYAEWITWRGANAGRASEGPTAQETVKNRFSGDPGPNGIIGTSVDDLNETPANVNMIDPELGIFSLDFFPSISARAVNYLHSALTTTPSGDPTDENAVWLQDGELYASREVSAIVSCIVEAPNNNHKLHQELVTAKDCGGVIAQQKDGETRITIRVDPGVAMARYEWDDALGADIKEFFAGNVDDHIGTIYPDGPINGPELRAVAVLKAREVYARYVDSYEGGVTTGQRDILPTGAVKEIKHEASPAGILTSVSMPEGRPPLDLSQYMPASVRKLVDRGGES